MTETLKDQLIRHEGLKLKPYRDSEGKLTIGVGRNLDDVGLSKPEVMILLDNDIQRASDDVRRALPWVDELDWPRKSVLINMCFNMGIGNDEKGLLSFKKTLEALKNKNYADAAARMLDSKWARQVGPRAIELSEIIKGDRGL